MGCGHQSGRAAEIDTRNNMLNTKTAMVSEIILGPGDVLNLSVWQNKDFSGPYTIDPAGNIFIPLVGNVVAGGLSAHRLKVSLIMEFKKYIVDPQVQLAVTSYRSRKVYVLGEVKKPGIYQMDDTLTSVVSALAAAGGFTGEANSNSVVHLKEGLDKGDARVLRMGAYLQKRPQSRRPPAKCLLKRRRRDLCSIELYGKRR